MLVEGGMGWDEVGWGRMRWDGVRWGGIGWGRMGRPACVRNGMDGEVECLTVGDILIHGLMQGLLCAACLVLLRLVELDPENQKNASQLLFQKAE